MTEEQLLEFRMILNDVQGGWAEIKALPNVIKTLQSENTELKGALGKLKKEILTLAQRGQPIRKHEVVTHDCARYLAAIAYIGAEKHNKLSHLNSQSRDLILNKSAEVLGMELRAALTTTDIPLPIEFQSQVVELVWKYGDFRRYATPFPMGAGTVKLPKLKTSPAFGLIALSA